MNTKNRVNRIDNEIDRLFELATGKKANENVYPVSSFARECFNIDMDRTAQIFLGATMDGSKLIDSESIAYLEFCEKKLNLHNIL